MVPAVLLLSWALGAWAWPQELPSYPHYPDRLTYALTGTWNFSFDPTYDPNVTALLPPGGVEFNETESVPGAWDAAWGTGRQYSRGSGFYGTAVSIPPGRPAALHFAACSMFCRVYIDGMLVHNHTLGGFTPFWVEVPPSARSDRDVTVLTSNVFNPTLTPTQRQNYDFYQYGGLIRPVSLHILPANSPSIDRVEVVPLSGGGGVPSGLVNLTVCLRKGASRTVHLSIDWGGGHLSRGTYTATAAGVIQMPAVPVPEPKIWQPVSKPTSVPSLPLHEVTVAVLEGPGTNTKPVDSIKVRFGLRIVSTAGREIRVNGKAIKLKGFNRHDLYPNLGPTLGLDQYEKDLTQLQIDLHANFIRGSHYPQDARLLDLCDERGILVWDEALAWGNWAPTLVDPLFMAAELGTANRMVDEGINHPSIILWGFFNEGQSDNPEATPSYAAMANTFHSRDPSRLVTWASNRMESDKGFQYADVISFNRYPGWYNGPPSGVEDAWRGYAAWVAATWPDKPFIISETGAGGIKGNHSDNATSPARWSEELQAEVDDLDVSIAMNCANVSGIALWQLMDIKVDQSNSSTNRPGGINNKGILDRWRVPKLAAAKVRAAYGALP